MTKIPLPENYSSLETLSTWLEQHLPHVDHWGEVRRWDIMALANGTCQIWFNADADATLFTLKWPR